MSRAFLVAGPVDKNGTPVRPGDWILNENEHRHLREAPWLGMDHVVRVRSVSLDVVGWKCFGVARHATGEVMVTRRCDVVEVVIRAADDPGFVDDDTGGTDR